MKKVILLSHTYLDREPRVRVQLRALKDSCDITCIGLTDPNFENVSYLECGNRTLMCRIVRKLYDKLANYYLMKKLFKKSYYSRYYVRKIQGHVKDMPCDVVICHDLEMLPIGVDIKEKTGAKLYLDAHEFTPGQFYDEHFVKNYVPYWEWIIKEYGHGIDFMTTVCQMIKDEYEKKYGLNVNHLVYNVPDYIEGLSPTEIDEDNIKLVHHGVALENRKLESMIDLIESLPEKYTLDLFLVVRDPDYYASLLEKIKITDRITIHDPVETEKISTTINQYDIGLFLLYPESFNQKAALPNKLFEFIHGCLAVAIWPSPEMKNVVDEYENGIVSEEFNIESIRDGILSQSAEALMEMKKNSQKAAKVLNTQKSYDIICQGVNG